MMKGTAMKKILIVEPSKSFAQFVQLVLSRLNYKIFHTIYAEEALKIIRREIPDLIICETVLSDKGGIELCKIVKKEPITASIPVVFISTDGFYKTREDAKKAGGVDYLTKPVTVRDLHNLMQRHLPYNLKRYNLRASIILNLIVDDGSKALEMNSLSIGEGGIYIETLNPNPVGTLLKITLPLPSLKEPLRLKGKVIYINDTLAFGMPKGMGVKFVELDQNTITLLSHYMESYLSDFLPFSPSTTQI